MAEERSENTTGKANPGRNVLGNYTILRKLGAGAMGEVFEAQDSATGKRFALKILPKELAADETKLTRFKQEARTAGKLAHKNIVTVHELAQDKGRVFFVMDLVQGETLQDILKREEISVVQAARFARQVAEALAHAHENGVIHRDIKPSNLMVDSEKSIYLTDFGVAKEETSSGGTSSEDGIVGTPNYMSPEQAKGRHDLVSARSDIYSLGATFYEMLTRSAPFNAANANAVLRKVIEDDPRPPSMINGRVPRALDLVCLKAMRKKPERRYDCAADMSRDLDRWLTGKPVLARPEAFADVAARWIRRHKGFCAGAVVLVLIAAIVGIAVPSMKSAAKARAENAKKAAESAAADLVKEGYALIESGGIREARLKFQAALEKSAGFPDAAVGLEMAEEAETRAREAQEAARKRKEALREVSLGDPHLQSLLDNTEKYLALEKSIDDFLSPSVAGDDYEGGKLNHHYAERVRFRSVLEENSSKAREHYTRAVLVDPACEEVRERLASMSTAALKIALIEGRRTSDYSRARRLMSEAARYNISGAVDAELAAAAAELSFLRQVAINVSPTDASASLVRFDLDAGLAGETVACDGSGFQLPPGSYVVTVECDGYVPTRFPVFIPAYEPGTVYPPFRVEFSMIPENTEWTGMVFVPAGKFLKGGPDGLRAGKTNFEELPAFFIDRTEVTCAQYRAFLEDLEKNKDPSLARRRPATLSNPGISGPDMPVTGVTLEDAAAYASWAGKRLPTDSEWEKAARGADARLYPWGSRFDETRCVHKDNPKFGRLSAVGSIASGESPYGCLDMAGNAAEWTSTEFYGYFFIRGGSYRDPFDILRTNSRDCIHPTGSHDALGFRCVKEIR